MQIVSDIRHDSTHRTPVRAEARAEVSSLIRLGRITTPRQADLARQALAKVGRCWHQGTEALLLRGPGAARTTLWTGHCTGVDAASFGAVAERHLRAGHLFVPTANEASSELALYALASGVPLEAICLERLALAPGQALRPLGGELYLKVSARPN